MNDAAWQASLEIGRKFEERCVELVKLRPETLQVYYQPGGFQKSHDFSFTTVNKHHSVECKCDAMAPQTGNCFIQTGKDGKAHGIITTTATFWFFNIGDPLTGDILVLKSLALYKHLRTLIDAGLVKRVDGAGRSSNTTGYLLTIGQLKACPGAWEWKITKENNHA